MNAELGEKIEGILLEQMGVKRTDLPHWWLYPDRITRREEPKLLTNQILSLIKQAGYRLIPELTLIDDEEIRILTGHTTSFDRSARDSQIEYSLNEVKQIAQAQLSHTKKQLNLE